MNFAALKLNFKEYLLKNAELPEEKKELESGDVSIFDYTDEFKEYLSKEYNIDTSDFFQNLRILSQYEIVDGQLVFPGDEEEVSDEAAENQDVDETDADEIDMEGEYDPENLMVDMMNELLQDEEYVDILDENGDGEVDSEEMQDFFSTISTFDGKSTDISYEDITNAVTQIQKNEFEFVDNSAEIAHAAGSQAASSSNNVYSASTPDAKEKTIENMSLDELNNELETQQTELADYQSDLSDILSGKNSELQAIQSSIDSLYDLYLSALEEVDVELAEQLDDTKVRMDEKQDEIDQKDMEIANAELDVTEKQNTYNSAVLKRNNLQTIVSSLEAEIAELDDEEDADEIAELEAELDVAQKALEAAEKAVESAQMALNSANENLAALQEQKEGLENEMTEIEDEMTEIENQIAEQYPAVDKLKQNYDAKKDEYDLKKETLLNKAQSNIQTTQKNITEIQEAITNLENKQDTREYSHSNSDLPDGLFQGALEDQEELVSKIAQEYGIEPEFLAAIICLESAYGGSNLAQNHYNFGGVTGSGDAGSVKTSTGYTFACYSSVEKGLEAMAKNLAAYAERYSDVDSVDINNVSAIGNHYCVGGNWASKVSTLYNQIKAKENA